MKICKTIAQTRRLIAAAKKQGKIIGFVPTMGALHDGHFWLIEAAKKQCDFVVVSIFVNPTQFAPNEDINKYPRTLKKDLAGCKKCGAELVFAPTVKQMYPAENLSWVNVEKITDGLCGKSRPCHFKGVATVCTKLFNIVSPDIAFFGQKDWQQALVIKQIVKDLNMPLKIVVCPTVREPDGLAMSSRNKYLTPKQRKEAALLYAALQEAQLLINGGVKNSSKITAEMEKIIKLGKSAKIDYITIAQADTLQPLKTAKGKIVIALAVKIGKARLIDNILVCAD